MQKIDAIGESVLKNHFHWPSDDDQIWRHFTDYTLIDKKGNVIEDMLVEEGSYRAQGTLLARPGSNFSSIQNIEICFSTYAIDFGKSLHDAARGYWIKGMQKTGDDVWYKMEKSSVKYARYSNQMEEKVDNFLQLHDTLTKGNYEFVTTNPYSQLVSCKLTIMEFHRRTSNAFDFQFVEDNCEFVLDHLKNNLDPEKSIKFLESIVKLGNISRKDFINLFPALKIYYRDLELKRKSRGDEEKYDREESRILKRKSYDEDDNDRDLNSELDDTNQRKKISRGNDEAMDSGYFSNIKNFSQTDIGKKTKKKSVIDEIEDMTMFKKRNISIDRQLLAGPRDTKVKWYDFLPNGKLFEKHDIDYELIFDVETKASDAELISILKKPSDLT